MFITFNIFQAFIIGICIGSFLNVVIYRLPNNLSIVKPRSFCPICKKRLTFFENIPLISWSIQKGSCRNCNKPIVFRYPLIELITGLLFIVFRNSTPYMYSFSHDFIFNIIFSWIFLSLLICITFIDIDNLWIPQSLINLGFSSGILVLIFIEILNNTLLKSNLIIELLFSSAGAFVIFESLRIIAKYIFKKDAIGKGDSKLVAMIALWLGPIGVLLAVGIAYIVAALFCILGISLKRIKLRQVIPFAPFLSIGGLIIWFNGNQFILEQLLKV